MNGICPASPDPCNNAWLCDKQRLCTRLHFPSIDTLDAEHTSALHFVGFRGDEYTSAYRAFGPPDFIHYVWDIRATCDIAPGDTVVFAKYNDTDPSPFGFDDSNQPDDPAAKERLK